MSQTHVYKVFFAIPFDAATKSMYDTIIEDLRNSKFKDDFRFSLGTTSVDNTQPDCSKIEQFKIEEFKAQNQDFLTRFVHVIKSSDIIIADLTNNNASVHIELGIALTLNKNILRVSGRDLIDVATDLRGYEVNKYTCRQQLRDWIVSYLAYFRTIKRTPPTLIIPDWHDAGRDTTGLDINNAKRKLNETQYYAVPAPINGRTRDSEIRLCFKFIETFDDGDWFAVLLRNETANPWLGSGSFVFARLDGRLEIHNIPTREDPLEKKVYPPLGKNTEHVLRVNIDGNHLSASLDEELESGIHVETVEHQSPGNVFLSCYRSFVKFGNVELAQHDAIAFR
jgi:hypothetical protein